MTPTEIVSRMRERVARDPESFWWPDKAEVLHWVADDVGQVRSLFEEVAEFIARGYENGNLSFDLCDGIVNGMYASFLELPLTQMPPVFYDVFLAFDAGEYDHTGDDTSVNPVEKYTNPQIRKVLEGRSG